MIKECHEQLIRKRYSPNTINAYIDLLKTYKYHCQDNAISPEDESSVKSFILDLVNKGLSHSAQNQAINAIKFYFEKVLGKERKYYEFDRPRKQFRLPNVLTKKEVRLILDHTTNLKHRVILTSIYSLGLRVGELLHLKLEDYDKDRKYIRIRQSKGNKDRIVPVPEKLVRLWNQYYKAYKPTIYLIEGQRGKGTPYSYRSIQAILKRSCREAGIVKKVHTHTLRHSYATHLMDNHVDLRTIQVLLGHNSLKTTQIYTHLTDKNILDTPSPLDFLY